MTKNPHAAAPEEDPEQHIGPATADPWDDPEQGDWPIETIEVAAYRVNGGSAD